MQSRALAQESETEPASSPADTVTSPAQPATTGEDTAWTRARELVGRGEALFAIGNYDAAMTEFLAAHRELAGHPRQYVVLHNIALCHERMFRYDLALEFYERYLNEGGAQAEDRAAVSSAVETLRGLLATVQIASNVGAEVWVDNRRMADAPGQVMVPAGRHVIELRAELRESARLEVQVAARQDVRVTFVLKPLSDYRGLSPTYFWIGAGISVAALSVGAILGANALEQSNSARERGPEHIKDQAAKDRVNKLALGADVCFGAALVFGVTSTVLFFLTDWDGGEREAQPGTARARVDGVRVVPVAGRDAFGATLRGGF